MYGMGYVDVPPNLSLFQFTQNLIQNYILFTLLKNSLFLNYPPDSRVLSARCFQLPRCSHFPLAGDLDALTSKGGQFHTTLVITAKTKLKKILAVIAALYATIFVSLSVCQ